MKISPLSRRIFLRVWGLFLVMRAIGRIEIKNGGVVGYTPPKIGLTVVLTNP